MNHTPGPHIENELLPDMLPLIYYEVDDENETCTILGDGQIYIGKIDSIDGYNKEITESILHRVNTHAALVEALKSELETLNVWLHSPVMDDEVRLGVKISIDKIERALTLAEGKESGS